MNNITQNSKWEVSELNVIYHPNTNHQIKILSSTDCFNVLKTMWHKDLMELQEQFGVLFLNRNNRVIGYRLIGTGNMVSTIVDKKLIGCIALKVMACGVIICHNHPSGNLIPSQVDIKLTSEIEAALKLFEINLLDHLIITKTGYYSFKDEGLI